MSTYAVGDIQGCLQSLKQLLDQVNFDPNCDCLWVAGDLVNRGPDSLGTLRYLYQHQHSIRIVLGNHDLHLLACEAGYKSLSSKDTLQDILQAPDKTELLDWLCQQPLIHTDPLLGYSMVHAGIPPMWTLSQAINYAKEVHQILRCEHRIEFFAQMYGNMPNTWDESLTGTDRLRCITNYFTRMRFCDKKGKLELKTKCEPSNPPPGYLPWFEHPKHKCHQEKILFGHWAALVGETQASNFIGLDTGCVWGGCLSMICLEDQRRYSVNCPP